MKKVVLLIGFILSVGLACAPTNDIVVPSSEQNTISSPEVVPIEPPRALKIPFMTMIHGYKLIDNYHWLKDKTREKQEVIDYLTTENEYAAAVTKHTEKFQEKIYQEIIGRMKQTDLNVPVQRDDYYYYSRTEEGKQYPIYCRKKGSLDATEEIIFDMNKMAEGHSFYMLGDLDLSEDHRYLAYSVDTEGSELYRLYIKDLRTGTILSDTAYPIGNCCWASDNKTLFYSTVNEARRSDKIYRHVLGSESQEDVLIHHEKDDAFYSWVEKTRSRKYLILGCASETTSEIRYLRSDTPRGEFQLIQARLHGVEYYITHNDDLFYIITNADGAKNFKVMTAPVQSPEREHWQDYIEHRDTVFLNKIDVFKDFLVIDERDNGIDKLRIRSIQSGDEHYVSFPEPIYTYYSHENPEFDTQLYRFSYTSLVTPSTVYDYNMTTRTKELKKQKEVLGGYDSTQFESERVFATASDGTKIPMSLVYKIELFKKDGSNPLLLDGYGAYGFSNDPYFTSNRLTLLDRGFVLVFSHIRGGRDLGEIWYEQGKMLHKKNTFTDYITCAEWLIQEQYTSAQKLVLQGGSAGGLLVGAVANMHPDLCHIIVADVPFVDVLNTMLDPSLPATVHEYEEWGNPNEKQYFDYIRSYCPYQNVSAQNYPHIIIQAGFYDTRVNYWEPAKWVSKLRDLKTDTNKIIFKINMSGHGGASGWYDFYRELAFQYAVMLDFLGITA